MDASVGITLQQREWLKNDESAPMGVGRFQFLRLADRGAQGEYSYEGLIARMRRRGFSCTVPCVNPSSP
jgi:hypothetical protein